VGEVCPPPPPTHPYVGWQEARKNIDEPPDIN